jgi:hypothetical protein
MFGKRHGRASGDFQQAPIRVMNPGYFRSVTCPLFNPFETAKVSAMTSWSALKSSPLNHDESPKRISYILARTFHAEMSE